MPKYQGRLELTWTNKSQRLLAGEDGAYEWVAPADYRVAEVRLLHDAGVVGEIHPERERAKDNLLIRGDALNALNSLINLPEFAAEYAGKVKLVYLDPPFNTQQSFLHYDDALEHSVWLTMMRDRLLGIKTLLSEDGSVWVHCDDSEQAYLKVMMDEVFGREGFVAGVVWQKLLGRENRTDFSTTHDYIMVFALDRAKWSESRNVLPFGAVQLARYSNPDHDPRGPWTSGDLSGKAGPGRRQSQFYPITVPSGRVVNPPPGRCWIFTRERLGELMAENRIWFREGGSVPRIKRFLSEVGQGLVPATWWPAEELGTNDSAKKEVRELFPGLTPFATPKPENLLQRIMQVSSNPGDIVLDCFLGSATTAAVAHKMGRRWVGVEISAQTVEDFAVRRLAKVVRGEDPGGITKAVDWQGGGGFRMLEVAPSMFESQDGQVFLSRWATNGRLAEAAAAQLGFEYRSDPPFSGRQGRSRLAVVDGLVTSTVVDVLLRSLAPDETVTVCGAAVDPEAQEALRSRRPGSSARRVPQSILREYRRRQAGAAGRPFRQAD